MSESKVNVLKAINDLSLKVEGISLEENKNLRYKITTYDGLLDSIRKEAVDLGLVMVPHDVKQTNCTPYERTGGSRGSVRMNCDNFIFTFRVYHAGSGEHIEVGVPSVGLDEGDKGPGKAITYAAKYAWMQVLMLKRGDDADPDNRSSEGMGTKPAPAQQRPSTPVDQWDKKWIEYLDLSIANATNKKDIEDAHNFDWLATANLTKSDLKSKGCSREIGMQIVEKFVTHLLATALETRHAANVVKQAKDNWPKMIEFLGEAKANALKAKMKELEKPSDYL